MNAHTDPSTNLGLWLDRYLGPQKPHPKKNKEAELLAFEDRRKQVATVRAASDYKLAFDRWETALRETSGGFDGGITRVFTATATSRIAVGLGQASVWENGITVSRTWGTPVIPGSALKGLASAYVARLGNDDWQKPDAPDAKKGRLQEVMFGSLDQAGEVTFHDAWWVPSEDCPIDRDVLTVHHQDYYRGKDSKGNPDPAPADWDDPNPVGFFTAWGQVLVALSGPCAAVDFAAKLLAEALQHEGIGAKTNAGYGRMILEAKLTVEEQQRETERLRLAQAQEERNKRLEEFSTPLPANGASLLATRLQRLFNADYSEDEQRRVVVQLLAHSRSAMENWLAKDAARPGATLVQTELTRVKVGLKPADAQQILRDKSNEGIRLKAKVTFTVKGNDVTLDAIEGHDCKPGQKAAAIAGKSPNKDVQKAHIKQLASAGQGRHQRELFVTLDGNKVVAIEFAD